MAQQKQTSRNRARTYARNRALYSRRGYEKVFESDGAYFLKLVLYVLLGTFWIKYASPISWNGFVVNALPVGLLVGLFIVHKYESLQYDRKIWYAVLIVVTIVSYFLPAGIII